MAGSIIQERTDKLNRECYLCRLHAAENGCFGGLRHTNLHKHHIMFGTANRRLSERYGLWVYVCPERHHEHGPESPHGNREVDLMLKCTAQRRFEEIHGHGKWMEVFGRNYL